MKLPKEKKSWVARLLRRVVYKNYGQNILYQLQLRALDEAVDYVQANMPEAMIFESYTPYLRHLMAAMPGDGLILEFGVAGGNSIRKIGTIAAPRAVHGFDSFEGLPEDWAGHLEQKGAFSQKKQLPSVPDNVSLHVGWFDATLPGFLDANDGPLALLHVDCDLYGGTKYILDTVRDRLRAGTVIMFDEYFNYPSWKHHEYKAWQEFVAAHAIQYSYLAYTATGGSVCVRIDSIGT
ncbi:MAG: methyltransferase [Ponticaulis sp.]|nr:methyltransferase [Ponticaulis sp.]